MGSGTMRGSVKWVIAAALLAAAAVPAFHVASYHLAEPLPAEARADRVVVLKGERALRLYDGERLLKRYRIGLGFDPQGHKRREGDGRTPEGLYTIDYRNPRSGYHLSLHVSYPDRTDRAWAEARRVDPGGDIMLHGLPNPLAPLDWLLAPFQHLRDWSAGCITLGNAEIEEIWRSVPDGTSIEIRP